MPVVLQFIYQHIDNFLEQFGSSIVTKLERHLSGCYLFISFSKHSYTSLICCKEQWLYGTLTHEEAAELNNLM